MNGERGFDTAELDSVWAGLAVAGGEQIDANPNSFALFRFVPGPVPTEAPTDDSQPVETAFSPSAAASRSSANQTRNE